MNNSATTIEESMKQPNAQDATAEPGKHSGIVLPPSELNRAIAALEALRQGSPEEQREISEILDRAWRERELSSQQAIPGLAFQPIDVEKAFRLLDQLDNFDPAEQRDTFEYLKQALNEERKAGNERLLFL